MNYRRLNASKILTSLKLQREYTWDDSDAIMSTEITAAMLEVQYTVL